MLAAQLREEGVCAMCVPRVVGDATEREGPGTAQQEQPSCRLCLGILQSFESTCQVSVAPDQLPKECALLGPGTWFKCSSLSPACLREAFKASGHELDNICVHVQVPTPVMLHSAILWRKMQSSCQDSQQQLSDQILLDARTIKHVVQQHVFKVAKDEYECYSRQDDIIISVAWEHPEESAAKDFLKVSGKGSRKRPRSDQEDQGGANTQGAGKSGSAGGAAVGNPGTGGGGAPLAALQHAFSLPQAKLLKYSRAPQMLQEVYVKVHRQNVLVGGRYLKLKRGVSQSPWLLKGKDAVTEASVEGEISAVILPIFQSEQLKFAASGREDKDVRMLGTGRPFVAQVIDAKNPRPTREQLEQCMVEIGKSSACVRVRGLQLTGPEEFATIKVGEDSKQKHYRALCWAARPLTGTDVQMLDAVKNLKLQQDTPVRVMHRRAPLLRERSIYSIKCELMSNPQWFALDLEAEAGTYIKEFCHGDFGRTQPNVGTLLGNVEVQIAELDVVHISLNSFC